MSTTAQSRPATAALLEALARIAGPAHLLTDRESLTFFSTDVYRQADVLAEAVIQPGSVTELQDVVRACAGHGAPMVVRGGGASYTDGYLPTRPGTVCIDASRLTGITVNAEDMYVTVEPGVTWARLLRGAGATGTAHAHVGAVLGPGGHRGRRHVALRGQLWFGPLRRVAPNPCSVWT